MPSIHLDVIRGGVGGVDKVDFISQTEAQCGICGPAVRLTVVSE